MRITRSYVILSRLIDASIQRMCRIAAVVAEPIIFTRSVSYADRHNSSLQRAALNERVFNVNINIVHVYTPANIWHVLQSVHNNHVVNHD
jgi:hypothetical protein